MILIDTLAKSSYSFGRKIVLLIAQFAMSIAYESFMRYYISSVFSKDYPKPVVEKSVEKVLKNPRHVVKSCFSATNDFDVASELGNIRVPTLIIHGSESLLPLSKAEYMREHIPNADLLIVEGTGHSIPVETPEKIWEAIEEFI
jgi:3-oxoadipate enol-lactonase